MIASNTTEYSNELVSNYNNELIFFFNKAIGDSEILVAQVICS